MSSDQTPANQMVLLEPGGLSVPMGSRLTYLFKGKSERTRFAGFIATGLTERDKCLIVTDPQGRELFSEALSELGVDVEKCERDGSLVMTSDPISVESIEDLVAPVSTDSPNRFRFSRFINDTSWMGLRGWTERLFFRLEVKGHLLLQSIPCTTICQYDTNVIDFRKLHQIIATHQFTIVGETSQGAGRVEKNPDRRPLTQIIFDGMDEQLRVLTRLQDLSLKLSASLDLDETLDAITEAATTICRAEHAAISCFDSSGDLSIIRQRGLSEEYMSRRRVKADDPWLSSVIASKRPIIIEDVDELGDISPNYEAWKREGIRSVVSLPLVSEGAILGVISAGASTVRRYTQTETDAMAILAAQASAAITNARLYSELREANHAKDEFLATLSHELRTPLTPILGWMHILQQFADYHPLLAQGLETIERNATQQSGLINDLLDLTRIISGKIELVREPTDLNALLEAIVEQARPQAEARQMSLTLSMPGDALVLDVDPVRLQQVVTNLVTNALKFTPFGGEVSISLRGEEAEAPGAAVIEVTDTGIGIDPDFLTRIFDRFSQASQGINRQYGGLGLGLAISRALVEMHGGEISAYSHGIGLGSRFTVRLPREDSEASARSAADIVRAPEEGVLEPLDLSVLVIEDSRDTLDMLKLWLDSVGCQVRMAADAMEGLKLAVESNPDIIISDIGMPEIDGYELIRQLRRTPGLETVPAIALTGYAREEDRELAMAAGYNAHLAKPAQVSRLYYLIRKLTEHAPPASPG
ncbi:MAG TPA: ATP-binding protein [Blastocatellia bacterium]|nr:ATP-binding protein [Blastocatellia bacterium]